jgi:hypothetical protein
MFDVSTIQTGFTGLIGWRDSENTELPALTTAQKATSSGLYFNDSHPLVTIENLDAIGPNYDGVANATYAAGTTYALNAVVRYNGVTYISLQATNIGKTPGAQPAWWKPQFCNYIDQLTNTAIINMVQRVIADKQLSGASKALLDDVKLFDRDGRTTSTIVGQSRFVGFEIKVKNFEGLIASVRQIGGQFSATQAALKIYLYHSSQSAAVTSYTMTTTKTNTMEWFAPTSFDMNFCKYSKNDAGGAWYIGYFEDDLTGQAINRDIDLVSEPCTNCWADAYNYFSWQLRNRFFTMTPCAFDYDHLDGVKIPDLDHIEYVSSNNWGLNLAITAHCDLTDFFVNNKVIFTRALWKQMAHDVIRQIAFSTRMDGITQTLRSDAYVELKGDPTRPYKSGLEYELQKEYEALNISIADVNSPCLSKTNKGIKVGGI